jgi:hypothetical protein
VLRALLVLAFVLLTLPARADEANEYELKPTGRWHLAIDAALFNFRRVAADPRGDFVRPGQDALQFGYADAIGLRVGYLWTGGWELGAVFDIGAWRSTAEPVSESHSVRFSPLAYLRYLLGDGSTRAFVGGVFGAELSRYRLRNEALQEQQLNPEQTTKTRSFAFGPEAGLRVLATDWLSIDPFVRWQINMGRTTFSPFPGGFDERSWRLLVGFAASFWI